MKQRKSANPHVGGLYTVFFRVVRESLSLILSVLLVSGVFVVK